MSSFFKTAIKWTGFPGGPGFTNLYWRTIGDVEVDQAAVNGTVTKVETWLNAWRPYFPVGVTTQLDSVVTEINTGTGAQIGFFNATVAAAAPGQDSAGYSAASGACINWSTAGVRNGRRIRGRTFMVPIGGTGFDGTGTLADNRLQFMRSSTATMLANQTSSQLIVWSRPTKAAPDSGEPWPVSAYSIPDKAAILTSRRD
jgi:hypothetical protein